jgi:drug/metabolite transporter (DMT)-like permease
MTPLFLAAMVVAALILMFPRNWRRKLMSFGVAFDLIGSALIVGTYASTGAASGLTVAILAALMLTITIRVLRSIDGYEVIYVNNERRLSVVVAALLSQSVAWIRSGVSALFRGGQVIAPAPLNIEWREQKDAPISESIRGWFTNLKEVKL